MTPHLHVSLASSLVVCGRGVGTDRSDSSFVCSTACNPSLCRAKGRGLQPKGLRVKETADFKVYTKGAGTGELKVTIKGPSECRRASRHTRAAFLTVHKSFTIIRCQANMRK